MYVLLIKQVYKYNVCDKRVAYASELPTLLTLRTSAGVQLSYLLRHDIDINAVD
jgi:hypothetical protein